MKVLSVRVAGRAGMGREWRVVGVFVRVRGEVEGRWYEYSETCIEKCGRLI
jgi:hypothetical protein